MCLETRTLTASLCFVVQRLLMLMLLQHPCIIRLLINCQHVAAFRIKLMLAYANQFAVTSIEVIKKAYQKFKKLLQYKCLIVIKQK